MVGANGFCVLGALAVVLTLGCAYEERRYQATGASSRTGVIECTLERLTRDSCKVQCVAEASVEVTSLEVQFFDVQGRIFEPNAVRYVPVSVRQQLLKAPLPLAKTERLIRGAVLDLDGPPDALKALISYRFGKQLSSSDELRIMLR